MRIERLLGRLQPYLGAAVVAVLLYAGWVFAGRYVHSRQWERERVRVKAPPNEEFERHYGGTDVRILQFYTPAASLVEGEHTTICYGVVNAASVRITPPVDGVSPSLNRCVQAAPVEDTRYTLYAEGADGRIVSESFLLQVRPDPATLPAIPVFRAVERKLNAGRDVFLLVFQVRNAVTVDIDPPVFPTLHGAPYGRFYVSPRKTTTYTLTATGKRGRTERKSLTIEAPEP
jgi:hypothetical protein